VVARAAAASKSQEQAAAVSAALSMLQKKWGNVAVELRPKLGAVQSFEIVKVAISVDGREVSVVDGKSFGQHNNAIEAWSGTIETGAHILAVLVEYEGNGHNVFSYFKGYRYTARSRTLFRVDEGARLHMLVDLVDKGGVNTAFEKRLAIAFAAEP
jgi:hypothetical protein